METLAEEEPDMGIMNLGKPDRDLADEFRALQEAQTSTLPSGRQVRPNSSEPFYGALSVSELPFLANPAGALAIHLVHAKNLNSDLIRRIFPTSALLDLYIRVDFLQHSFFSKLCVDVERTSRRVVFDHLVTFSIDDVAINEKAETQNVVFSLVGVDEQDPQRHVTIGSAEKPLLSFIRGMIGSEVVLLTRPARTNPLDGRDEGQWTMGILLIKSAFAYGRFGYGYANQLFDERMAPSDAVKHSLFPRFHPSAGRTQAASGTLQSKPIPPLKIIQDLGQPVDIGHPLLRLDMTEMDEETEALANAVPWLAPELRRVEAAARPFLEKKTKKLHSMKGASRRIAYLQQICRPAPVAQVADVFGQTPDQIPWVI